MKHKLTTTLLLALCVPTALASTTWYVNGVTGSNKNNCKTPQTTIGRASGHNLLQNRTIGEKNSSERFN